MFSKKKNVEPRKRKRRLPGLLLILIYLAFGFFSINFFVQICKKPTELLRFAKIGHPKTPRQTWDEFSDHFRQYATDVITADFLAALVQVESSGNPLDSPTWTWRWTTNPWGLYGPPSTAVGLLQMTEGNFGAARTFCVHGGHIVREGAWYDPAACKLTILYSRLVPSHSIEMTSAFLDYNVQKLTSGSSRHISLLDKQRLAAVMHLCGPGKGPAFIHAKFNPEALGICGTQPVGSYVRLVMKYRAQFAQYNQLARL